MSVSAAMIVAAVRAAMTAWPDHVVAVKFGVNWQSSVSGLRTETQGDAANDLSGEISGIRGRVRIVLADCDPWPAPTDGDRIMAGDVEYTVLSHQDTAGATRLLRYGEKEA